MESRIGFVESVYQAYPDLEGKCMICRNQAKPSWLTCDWCYRRLLKESESPAVHQFTRTIEELTSIKVWQPIECVDNGSSVGFRHGRIGHFFAKGPARHSNIHKKRQAIARPGTREDNKGPYIGAARVINMKVRVAKAHSEAGIILPAEEDSIIEFSRVVRKVKVDNALVNAVDAQRRAQRRVLEKEVFEYYYSTQAASEFGSNGSVGDISCSVAKVNSEAVSIAVPITTSGGLGK